MSASKEPQVIERLFNRIAPKYDLVNRVLSLGIDRSWRHKVALNLPKKAGLELLDVASGTCDQILAILNARPHIKRIVAFDIAQEMLAIGKKKIPPHFPVEWCIGSAIALPYEAHTFDAVTISFGIRNVPDPLECLKEMERVLKTGGAAAILEFSLPKNALLRFLHMRYLRYMVPTIGGWLTGQRASYHYLNETIESFPYGENFCVLMKQAGFSDVKVLPLTGGIATLYLGIK